LGRITPEVHDARLTAARVARLATLDADGRPHLVPIVFALDGDTLYSAVDRKPKRSRRLRRIENARSRPEVTMLVDHFEEDWDRLWWIRLRGRARVLDTGDELARALALLREKYPQYRDEPPTGPVLAVDVVDVREWNAHTGPKPVSGRAAAGRRGSSPRSRVHRGAGRRQQRRVGRPRPPRRVQSARSGWPRCLDVAVDDRVAAFPSCLEDAECAQAASHLLGEPALDSGCLGELSGVEELGQAGREPLPEGAGHHASSRSRPARQRHPARNRSARRLGLGNRELGLGKEIGNNTYNPRFPIGFPIRARCRICKDSET
jgi:PPOX class probable F420-dependent enzyme